MTRDTIIKSFGKCCENPVSISDFYWLFQCLELSDRKYKLIATSIGQMPEISSKYWNRYFIDLIEFCESHADGNSIITLGDSQYFSGLNETQNFLIGICCACSYKCENSAAFAANSAVRLNDENINQNILSIILRSVNCPIKPEYRTSTVVSLAQQAYETKDFSIMPILADALQDAGYQQNDVLAQLRDTENYWFRGCNILDQILGKY